MEDLHRIRVEGALGHRVGDPHEILWLGHGRCGLLACGAAIRLADRLRQSCGPSCRASRASAIARCVALGEVTVAVGARREPVQDLTRPAACSGSGCGWVSPGWRWRVVAARVRTDRTVGKTRGR